MKTKAMTEMNDPTFWEATAYEINEFYVKHYPGQMCKNYAYEYNDFEQMSKQKTSSRGGKREGTDEDAVNEYSFSIAMPVTVTLNK